MAAELPGSDPNVTGLVWDTEDQTDLLHTKEGHLRGNLLYVTAPLWTDMLEAWGGVVTHVKTSTNVETGEVSVFKAKPDEEGAVAVHSYGSMNSAEFTIFRALTKLHMKVPTDRQFNLVPYTRNVPSIGTIFVFPLAKRVSVPRNRKEEAATRAAQQPAGGPPATPTAGQPPRATGARATTPTDSQPPRATGAQATTPTAGQPLRATGAPATTTPPTAAAEQPAEQAAVTAAGLTTSATPLPEPEP